MGAAGNINPCRFVKVTTSENKRVEEADANETVIGVSQEGAQDAPIPSASTLAAEDEDSLDIRGPGRVCKLVAGGGGWTAGDRLKSDADGKGVTIATTGTTIQHIGAIALESVSAGEKGDVLVVIYSERPALS